MTLQFFVPGIPKAQPRPRAFFNRRVGQARVYDAGTAEGWKGAVAAAASACRPSRPLDGPLRLDIVFAMPRPRAHYRTGRFVNELRPDAPQHHAQKPDRDNLEKAVMDALTQIGFWRDDGQVCTGFVSKVWSDRPGATITVTPILEAPR